MFTQADADQTLAALCRMIGLGRSELDPANGTFYDLLHEKLHVLAAATEPVDRALVAGLLQAKARVEADLRTGDRLPFEYTGDVEALLATATAALEAVGLKATGC